jgi:hypothetical protein
MHHSSFHVPCAPNRPLRLTTRHPRLGCCPPSNRYAESLTVALSSAPKRGDTLTGRNKTSEVDLDFSKSNLVTPSLPGLTSSSLSRRPSVWPRLSLAALRTRPPTAFACCYSPPAKSSRPPARSDATPASASFHPPREELLEEGDPGGAMAEEKESTSIPLSQAAEAVDPEDPAKSPPRPSSPTTSTRKVRI